MRVNMLAVCESNGWPGPLRGRHLRARRRGQLGARDGGHPIHDRLRPAHWRPN